MSSISSTVPFQPGDLESLVAMSRRYGAIRNSVWPEAEIRPLKSGDRLLVKASGIALETITLDGFVELDRRALAEPAGPRIARRTQGAGGGVQAGGAGGADASGEGTAALGRMRPA